MNCLDFRRLVMEDNTVTPAMRGHADECVACGAFAARIRGHDAQLGAALRVAAPETLAARILFRQQMTGARDDEFEAQLDAAVRIEPPADLAERVVRRARAQAAAEITTLATARRRPNRLVRFALAAGIAVGVASGTLLNLRPGEPQLIGEVMEHVMSEPWLMQGDTAVDRGDMEPTLAAVGLDLYDLPGRVTKAFPCPSRPQLSLHMVLDGAHDKLTVIVMPGERIDGPQRAQRGDWHGLVVPVRHGSLAIVGDRREDLNVHAEQVRRLLRWRV